MSGTEPLLIATAAANTGLGMIQSSRQAKAQNSARIAQYRQQQKQQTLARRIEHRKIERNRRKALAERRARLGAAGVGSSSGSGEAVLRGLNKDFDHQQKDSQDRFETSGPLKPNLLDPSIDMLRQGLSGVNQIVGVLPE